MFLHPALRYVIGTRWKNRVRSWLRSLRTWKGAATALVFGLAAVGLSTSGGIGTTLPEAQREASLVAMLGFMMWMQILSGLGQRGLVFSPADLDQLFPGPFRRRDLLLYQFSAHYVLAAFMGILFALFLGGPTTPSLLGLATGIALFMIASAHLHAAAAELSMKLADNAHARLTKLGRIPLALLGAAAVVLVVGVVSGVGDIPAALQGLTSHPAMRVLLYPAEQAVNMGYAGSTGSMLVALLSLLACCAASFALVVVIPVDILEASYATSQKMRRAREDLKRGIHRPTSSTVSSHPTGRSARGARSILWLNLLSLRRQLRALFGGLLMVTVMLAVLAGRDTDGGKMLLVLLAMIPLWMALPIGFRMPREQLVAIQLLPIPSSRLAAAMTAVPTLVPLSLQGAALLVLVGLGRLEPLAALPVLLAYAAVDLTLVTVEGGFALRRAQPNSFNLLQTLLQTFCQFGALIPGLIALTVGYAVSRSTAVAALLGAVTQTLMALLLLRRLGRRLRAEVPDGGALLG